MTPEQRSLVRESWLRCQPTLREAGAQFYQRLFALDPGARHLFAGADMAEQQRKLVGMFTGILRMLDRPDELVPQVTDLGRRHGHYGVKDGQYESVGAALLWTLEQGLGEHFTPEVREAWTEAYLLVATLMRRGAGRASGAVPGGRHHDDPGPPAGRAVAYP
jgi:hemoglobin-like flavoprotein